MINYGEFDVYLCYRLHHFFLYHKGFAAHCINGNLIVSTEAVNTHASNLPLHLQARTSYLTTTKLTRNEMLGDAKY